MTGHVCRRLMLFLDGTWNDDEGGRAATNIVYLRERLFWGLQERLRASVQSGKDGSPNDDAKNYGKLPEDFRKKSVSGVVFDGYEYIVYYDWGVGTGPLPDWIKGGFSGAGLDHNIRQAYRFLSSAYRPGDQIFLFGFSRGSYTARSLCGYLQSIGLLRTDQCTPENEARAWRYYRTPPGDRLSGDWSWFNVADSFGQARVHDPRYLRIRALGVFDTVGALGVPAQMFRRLNHEKYQFHDAGISSLVDIRLHAISIDDPRNAFAPTLWTKPKFKVIDPDKSPTEQVWFAGAHSDVGGGYVNWAAYEKGLSFIPLSWMIQRLNRHVTTVAPIAEMVPDGVSLTPDPKAPIPFFEKDIIDRNGITQPVRALHRCKQHKPWAKIYAATIAQRNHRVINQLSPNAEAVSASGRVAFADPICEMVHVSALERLHKEVQIDQGRLMNWVHRWAKRSKVYRPLTLTRMVPYLAATYLRGESVATPWSKIVEPIVPWKEARIVDWDGRPLDPAKPADARRAFDLMPTPAALGVTEMPEEMKYILLRDLNPAPQTAWCSPSPS